MKYLIGLVFAIVYLQLQAQPDQENNWILPFSTWLSFDSSPARIVHEFNDPVFPPMHDSSVFPLFTLSDKNGRAILLWSGIELLDLVHNKKLYMVPSYGPESAYSGALIPFENGNKVYFLYQKCGPDECEMCYRVVDVSSDKLTLGAEYELGTTSAIYTVAHANQKDTWIFSIQGADLTMFLIENDMPPRRIYQYYETRFVFSVSDFTFSPDLKYWIIGHNSSNVLVYGFAYLYRFDNTNGQIEFAKELPTLSNATFSADGKKIYANNSRSTEFLQYDFANEELGSPKLIQNSEFTWIKLGPDNKLYLANSDEIWVIDNPNTYQPSDPFTIIHGKYWMGEYCPLTRQWARISPNEILSDANCGLQAALSLKTNQVIRTYLWDFGDGYTSSVAAPTHTYAAAGNYTVSLSISKTDGTNEKLSKQITISQNPIQLTISWE